MANATEAPADKKSKDDDKLAEEVTIFEYTGFDQTFTVPQGAWKLEVKVWGAGGGGADPVEGEETGGNGEFFAHFYALLLPY